ncbi:hypothetical protein [Streptomyces sp. NPDC058247]|uniref:hypothetical protein n=1 Tax=Streptomyces sp. NPDC058247 TaxID=3346401 RepID=UPI0036EB50A9
MAKTREPDNAEAREVTESLRAALDDAGIVFPSLGVDDASFVPGLVNLGRVRADVAARLADVIRRGGRAA